MASEVISDIKIELSDLNNLCCHASLASKCLHEMIAHVRQRQRGDLSSIDLRGYAAGKNCDELLPFGSRIYISSFHIA